MICDSIINAEKYAFDARFAAAFDFIKKALDEDLPDGRYDLEGDRLFVNISTYQTKPFEDCLYEAHAKYADIQCIVSGEERIDVALCDGAVVTEDKMQTDDIAFYRDKEPLAVTHLKSGEFALFFPMELHKPCISVQNCANVIKKIVAKIWMDK